MSAISKEQIRELSEVRGTPCLSIYLPTYRAGSETQQNPIRYKNLMRNAEERLVDWGLTNHALYDFLAPLNALTGDGDLWQHQQEGFAVFRSPDFFRTYRLPESFDELVMVDDRLFLKPLFRLFGSDRRFYVLALSRNRVRLLAGDRFHVRELDLGEVPRSLEEALGEEVTQQTVNYHTRGPSSKGHTAGPIFHGHGAGDTDIKDDVRRFFHRVEDALPTLDLDRSLPMVVAGVDYLLPIYRDVSRWPNLVEEGITGNPDELRPEELHEQAWQIVEPLFQEERRRAAERYGTLTVRGRASSRLDEVVPAAHDGRVETLFTARGAHVWGFYDRGSREVRNLAAQRDGREDLLDLAAVQTVLHGGTVFSVKPEKVPAQGEPLAAIFRY